MTHTPSSTDSQPYVFPTADRHPAIPEEKMKIAETEPSETALDNGVDESFPASDPVSITVTKAVKASEATASTDTAPSTEFDMRNAVAGDRGDASGRNIAQDREVRQHTPVEEG